ncbi:hypothetical protein [Microbulbifer taiwanensis]|uniref:Uncharacterized protein n=1 Tax=Microbulbifer taiwanensis TaxID=986746 RepID=A0ABW1YIR0_9GAMM|nr:hypothetical protein [Microbulbifer taiwanensis]
MSLFKSLDTTAPDYTLTLNFNSQTLELEVPVEVMSVLKGSNLLLRFNNLPTGWSPMVEFRNGGGDIIMADGPFEQMIVGRNQVLAVNARSDIDQFHFRALIQRGFGIHSHSDTAVMFTRWLPFKLNSDSQQERLLKIRVLPDGDGLTVDKPQVTIRGGMRVQWDFSEVAQDNHQPMVAYGKPMLEQQPADNQQFFGPHESFVYRGNTSVEGNGNNGIKGIYRYEVYLLDIRTRAIVVKSSADPQTDNEGDVSLK